MKAVAAIFPTFFRRYGAIAALGASLACLLLALILSYSPEPRRELVLLVDQSGSVLAGGVPPYPDHVREMIGSADRASAVFFAGKPEYYGPLNGDLPSAPSRGISDSEETNIARAISLAASLPLEDPTRRRIILLSDGRENLDDALSAAASLAPKAVLESVPFSSTPTTDAKALSLSLATPGGTVFAGKPFSVAFIAEASTRVEANLIITLENGKVVEGRKCVLSPAGRREVFTLWLADPGITTISASVILKGDEVAENNEVRMPVMVRQLPLLGAVGGKNAPSLPSGYKAEKIAASDLDEPFLKKHSALLLDGVDAAKLPDNGVALLYDYVDSGGGLLVVASDMVAAGFDRPSGNGASLESLLPVSASPADSVAAVIAVDTSGSMGETVNYGNARTSKLSIAVSAVEELWRKLSSYDKAGIVSFAMDS
ncbi:MAG: VWA domain-containing protein, partial [Planctomycetes bacterium]|nr:VWA domain-containing protein [Planctomycetota bacterium]